MNMAPLREWSPFEIFVRQALAVPAKIARRLGLPLGRAAALAPTAGEMALFRARRRLFRRKSRAPARRHAAHMAGRRACSSRDSARPQPVRRNSSAAPITAARAAGSFPRDFARSAIGPHCAAQLVKAERLPQSGRATGGEGQIEAKGPRAPVDDDQMRAAPGRARREQRQARPPAPPSGRRSRQRAPRPNPAGGNSRKASPMEPASAPQWVAAATPARPNRPSASATARLWRTGRRRRNYIR